MIYFFKKLFKISNKKVTNYELTALTRGGLETVVSFNAVTFYDRDRNLQGVFASARDVTERKHPPVRAAIEPQFVPVHTCHASHVASP